MLALALIFTALSGVAIRSDAGASSVNFADPSFRAMWERTDQPVLSGRAQRSWYWGPVPGTSQYEVYSGSKSGTRLVQYFDKARMEVNDPSGDRNSQWFVTTGLLVAEMVSGKRQTGDSQLVPFRAAEIAVAGDGLGSDPEAPTYTSFRPVASLAGPGANRAPNRVGQPAIETITRAGKVGVNSALGLFPGARISAYSDVLGHNIPQAMWDFLNLKGEVDQRGTFVQGQTLANWVYVVGYPITEPYWARVRIGGVYEDVLIQLYQRRSLNYVPSAPMGWQVQMGNVGAHYYRWVYGGPLPTPLVPTPTPLPTETPMPTPTPRPTFTWTPPPTHSVQINPTGTAGPPSTPTSFPPPPRGTATPTPTIPVVPSEPPTGLLLSVQPGYGSPEDVFTFSAAGLRPGEQVQVRFTDPSGTVLYPSGSPDGLLASGPDGRLAISFTPSEAFPSPALGTWLFEVQGLQSGLDGLLGFTLR